MTEFDASTGYQTKAYKMKEKGLYKSAFQCKVESLLVESKKLLENATKEVKKCLTQ